MKLTNQEILARGRSAEIYAWGSGRVLKLFHQRRAPAQAEARISRLLHRAGLPVAEVFETLECDGRPGIVFEKIDGVSMLDSCVAQPRLAAEHGRLLAELHRELHATAIEALPDLGPALIGPVKNCALLSRAQSQALVSFLEKEAAGERLCHLDFHPDQVLLTDRGPRIIDWETAHRGNPLADVARTALILRIGQIHRPAGVSERDLAAMRNTLLSAYLDRYFDGQDGDPSAILAIWKLAAASLRLVEKIDGEKQQLKLIIDGKIDLLDEL